MCIRAIQKLFDDTNHHLPLSCFLHKTRPSHQRASTDGNINLSKIPDNAHNNTHKKCPSVRLLYMHHVHIYANSHKAHRRVRKTFMIVHCPQVGSSSYRILGFLLYFRFYGLVCNPLLHSTLTDGLCSPFKMGATQKTLRPTERIDVNYCLLLLWSRAVGQFKLMVFTEQEPI